MQIVKKLIFAPIFLIILISLISRLNLYFSSYDFIFSLTLDTFSQFVVLSTLILFTSLSFIIFASFASSWKYILPVIILASLVPLLFTISYLGVALMVSLCVSLVLIYLTLENTLKTYITFHPSPIFGPSIRNLTFMLILSITIVYFLSINLIIQKNGFQIPDSLIETSLKFIPKRETPTKSETPQPQIKISKEQIELLRQNPKLLEQYGLDPKILDTLDKPQNAPQTVEDISDEFLKLALKDQLDKIIKPYLSFIPISLALLFFITIQAITSFLNILIHPLLWIIFYLLEKSGFLQFTTEMRPVKKMVV